MIERANDRMSDYFETSLIIHSLYHSLILSLNQQGILSIRN